MNLTDLTSASSKLLELDKARYLREAQAKTIHPLTITGFLAGLSAGWALTLRTAYDVCRAEAEEAARAASEAALAQAKEAIEAETPSSESPKVPSAEAPHLNGSTETTSTPPQPSGPPAPYEER